MGGALWYDCIFPNIINHIMKTAKFPYRIRSNRLFFHLIKQSSHTTPKEKQFATWIRQTLLFIGKTAQISLLLCDEEAAQAYNQQYRGKDYATNVLSFELGQDLREPKKLLGDLIICPQVVEKEAVEQGKDLIAHYAHLTIHGVLHIAGFDHIDDEDAKVMEAAEIAIMQSLNYPNPYKEI